MRPYHLFLLSSLDVVLATPLARRGAIDLDGNGVPDWCIDNKDGSANCLENGTWTRVVTSASKTTVRTTSSHKTPPSLPTSRQTTTNLKITTTIRSTTAKQSTTTTTTSKTATKSSTASTTTTVKPSSSSTLSTTKPNFVSNPTATTTTSRTTTKATSNLSTANASSKTTSSITSLSSSRTSTSVSSTVPASSFRASITTTIKTTPISSTTFLSSAPTSNFISTTSSGSAITTKPSSNSSSSTNVTSSTSSFFTSSSISSVSSLTTTSTLTLESLSSITSNGLSLSTALSTKGLNVTSASIATPFTNSSSTDVTPTTTNDVNPLSSTSIAASFTQNSTALYSNATVSSTVTSTALPSLSLATLATSSTSTTTSTTTSIRGLPAPSVFAADKGTKWNITMVGNLGYTDRLANMTLYGDKCRTGMVAGRVMWNCGDMQCGESWLNCGFDMGPAFWATSSVMTVNTDGITNIGSNTFVKPWSGDPTPQSGGYSDWGMDTSNVVPLDGTRSVVYAWEIWRNVDGSYSDRGNAVAIVTAGATQPVATRMGPLLTGGDAIQLGLVAIMRDGSYVYIYSYSANAPSRLVVTRVPATVESVLDASKYEALVYGSNSTWNKGIPKGSDTNYGMVTDNGIFGCAVYGSVFYNTYLKKYVIICNIFMWWTNMYTSDTPWGPWSAEYTLLPGVVMGYGSHAHPEFGNGQDFYFSQGPGGVFNMFKVSLGGYLAA